jgi:hypothetical protein
MAAGREHVDPVDEPVVDVEVDALLALPQVLPSADLQMEVEAEPPGEPPAVAMQDAHVVPAGELSYAVGRDGRSATVSERGSRLERAEVHTVMQSVPQGWDVEVEKVVEEALDRSRRIVHATAPRFWSAQRG